MKYTQWRELTARFRQQYGLMLRREARSLGLSSDMEKHRVATGELERLGTTLLRLTASVRSPEQSLLAVCLAAGHSAVASHQSATWLWGLTPAPDRHSVTLGRMGHQGLPLGVPPADVHRLTDYPQVHIVRGIPVTNPLRALVDFAGVASDTQLDDAIDRALAIKLVTVEGIEAEMARLSRPGRSGTGKMRAALQRRGYTGVPHPSVLESRTLRLLRQAGIKPLNTEVRMGPDGRYRVDVLLAPGAIMEVDGHAYHFTPEQKAEDERRRKRLRDEGNIVNVYTWRDILYESARVTAEARRAIWDARHRMANSQLNGGRGA